MNVSSFVGNPVLRDLIVNIFVYEIFYRSFCEKYKENLSFVYKSPCRKTENQKLISTNFFKRYPSSIYSEIL